MSKIPTLVLLLGVLATGLIALFLAVNAASTPFALHMGIMTLWSLLFAVFILRRAARPT